MMESGGPLQLGDGIAGRVRAGPGERVLWLHGYTMDSSIWSELWDRLPGWYHIGVDLPGHGASGPLGAGEDLPGLATRLGRLALDADVRHVVALSFGTIVALQVAIEFPDAFASVTLAAPALVGGPQDPDVSVRYLELARLYAQRGPGPHMRALWMHAPPDLFRHVADRPELWRRLSDVIGQHRWTDLIDGRMYALTRRPQSPADLRRIRAALLVVLGEYELPAFRECARLIRAGVEEGTQTVLPQVGHLCLLEAPDAAAPAIHRHLSAHSTPVAPRSGR